MGPGSSHLPLRGCGLCPCPWAQRWHACPLLRIIPASHSGPLVLLGAKPRWWQEARATTTAPFGFFYLSFSWQHKLLPTSDTWGPVGLLTASQWEQWELMHGSVLLLPKRVLLPQPLQHLQPEAAPFCMLNISFGKVLRVCFLQVTCKGIAFIHRAALKLACLYLYALHK